MSTDEFYRLAALYIWNSYRSVSGAIFLHIGWVLLISAITVAIWKCPQSFSTKYVLLLLPLCPAAFVVAWGGYCMLHQSPITGSCENWQVQATELSLQLSCILTAAQIIFLLISKRWQRERLFASLIAILVLVGSWACHASAAMTMSNCWP